MRRIETATEILARWDREGIAQTYDQLTDLIDACRGDAEHYRENGYLTALAIEEELIELLRARRAAIPCRYVRRDPATDQWQVIEDGRVIFTSPVREEAHDAAYPTATA